VNKLDFQRAHEPAHREPEVIAHENQGLEPLAVTLPERLHKFRGGSGPSCVQPLLELVKNDEDLRTVCQSLFAPECGHRRSQLHAVGQIGNPLAEGLEQARLGSFSGGFDVDRQDVSGQTGKKPRFDQRRLATTAGAINEANREAQLVGRLDALFPESNALGQAVLITRAGQKLEEEVGVIRVERTQPFRDDGAGCCRLVPRNGSRLDRLALGSRGRARFSDIPIDDEYQCGEGLANVRFRHLSTKPVCADVSEHAHRATISLQSLGEVTVLDEPLEQVFKRTCPGRFLDPRFEDVAHNIFEDLAGPCERHLRVELGNLDSHLNALPKFGKPIRKPVDRREQVLECLSHENARRVRDCLVL